MGVRRWKLGWEGGSLLCSMAGSCKRITSELGLDAKENKAEVVVA
jgi:hypothetical protein